MSQPSRSTHVHQVHNEDLGPNWLTDLSTSTSHGLLNDPVLPKSREADASTRRATRHGASRGGAVARPRPRREKSAGFGAASPVGSPARQVYGADSAVVAAKFSQPGVSRNGENGMGPSLGHRCHLRLVHSLGTGEVEPVHGAAPAEVDDASATPFADLVKSARRLNGVVWLSGWISQRQNRRVARVVSGEVVRPLRVDDREVLDVRHFDPSPGLMAVAVTFGTLCAWLSTRPAWIDADVAYQSGFVLRRWSALGFDLLGATGSTAMAAVLSLSFLLASMHQPAVRLT